MIVTTTSTVEGRPIAGTRASSAARPSTAIHVGKDFKAFGRNIVGGRAGAYEDEIDKAQSEAMAEMQKAAEELGANAIVGVALDIEGVGTNTRCCWSPCRARPSWSRRAEGPRVPAADLRPGRVGAPWPPSVWALSVCGPRRAAGAGLAAHRRRRALPRPARGGIPAVPDRPDLGGAVPGALAVRARPHARAVGRDGVLRGTPDPCAILGAMSTETPSSPERSDFIREIVAADLREGRHQTVVTRFPPEPNGYLHIGHAKSICLNFGIAQEFGGRCHLRFDDTNPMKEEQEYIDAIEADVRWLGFDWGEHLYFASDYFEQLYEWAVDLIKAGKAYVDDLSADEIREHRGTLTEPGRESPWRDRPAEESLDLFARMRAGEFPDGARVLRAKIDMASAQHQPARPGPVPDPPRGASADRRRVVRLPDLRLRPRAVRRDRGHHALHLHAGVPGPPAALRLVHRQPAGALAPAPVRVRPAQPHPHRPLEARAPAPRQRGPRARLGRPADAHPLRPAPARLPRRGDPRLRGDDRRGQGRQRRRGRDARARGARRPQPHGAPPLRRPRPPQGRHRELPRGAGRGDGGPQQPGGPVRREPPGALHAGALDRARRLHGGAAEEVLPPGPRPRGAAAVRVLRHLPRGRQGRRRPGRRAALHVRPGHARRRRSRRPPPQGDAALGVGRARRARRGPALRPPLPRARTPGPTAATSSRT